MSLLGPPLLLGEPPEGRLLDLGQDHLDRDRHLAAVPAVGADQDRRAEVVCKLTSG